ncbi:MAG: PKD domain-containing protein [Reichenbachiella sp.]|uniref:PKD domain-containing protein n=1 Tax=Reichenbachiella sp. TaxID=2184521 RepID=UPI0029667DD4|nr:PKD domain-containing protein [Reichenbachiella sp.]MDW3212033.1 PKD domain-containing protein [Reichenbachiella sp.]
MNKFIVILTMAIVTLLAFSCGNDDFPVPQSRSVDADFEFSFSDGDFAPSEVTFTSGSLLIDGVGDVTYTWNMGDGTSLLGETVSHTYTEPSDYEVYLVVQSADDMDAISQTVTVRDPNALLVEVLFIDAGDFKINNLDGTSFDVAGFGTGLAYDFDNQLLYFTDEDNGTLSKANVDGSDIEVVVSGLSEPRAVALDVANQMAYVTDRGTNEIVAVDLSDNSKSTLYDNASDGLGELPVGIAYYDGNLYVTCVEIGAEAVWKGNVDGSGITRIIDYSGGGYGYGIAIDEANEKIYFDNTDNSEILRANLDGSSVEPVLETANRAYGIAIDNTNSKMYWTERNTGNVLMADLNGANKITIGAGYNDPRSLVFIP